MTTTTPSTGAQRRPSAPCHPIISRWIDQIVSALDEERRPLHRKLLKLQKRIVEIAIPAWYPAEVR